MFFKIVLIAQICHFYEKSIIANDALVLKYTFAPRFASIQAVLDSVEFWEIYVVIPAKVSNFCCYMLSFSFIFVVFIFCKNKTYSLMYKTTLVHLCIKPRQTCQHLGAVSYRRLYKALK